MDPVGKVFKLSWHPSFSAELFLPGPGASGPSKFAWPLTIGGIIEPITRKSNRDFGVRKQGCWLVVGLIGWS